MQQTEQTSPVLFGTCVYCILQVCVMTVNSMLHTCLSYTLVHAWSDATRDVLFVMCVCVMHVWCCYMCVGCMLHVCDMEQLKWSTYKNHHPNIINWAVASYPFKTGVRSQGVTVVITYSKMKTIIQSSLYICTYSAHM